MFSDHVPIIHFFYHSIVMFLYNLFHYCRLSGFLFMLLFCVGLYIAVIASSTKISLLSLL